MASIRSGSPKPRVFVSSVINGFEEFRAAARAGIEAVDAEPVLVNEDFPALAASSRNACLDAVASCDYLLCIIGARGGWMTPSGKLVVEEEFEEAQRRKHPIFAFVQEGVSRDDDAARLVVRLSDYISGSFRKTFRSPHELRDAVQKALEIVFVNKNPRSMSRPASNYFTSPYRVRDQAMLRFVLAPERKEEVVDPVKLASDDFRDRVLELAHSKTVRLFNYQQPKTTKLEADALRIEQDANNARHDDGQHVLLQVRESGDLIIDASVTGRRDVENYPALASYIVSVEDIEAALRQCFSFSAVLYGEIDRFQRQHTFLYNAALSGLGYRQLERNPEPRRSFGMSMRDQHAVFVAHEDYRRLSRSDLTAPSTEIERTILRLEQRAKA